MAICSGPSKKGTQTNRNSQSSFDSAETLAVSTIYEISFVSLSELKLKKCTDCQFRNCNVAVENFDPKSVLYDCYKMSHSNR
mmetsp:Transcript_11673/g.33586  ORF Transcript_11673/g.33586 Transcript_11673/m.33586 type:complete len:82 (+) Transcript_11673:707-952(+)